MKKVIANFVLSYLQTAAWVTCESGECTDFTMAAKKSAQADCKEFIEAVMKSFGRKKGIELLTIQGNDFGCLSGHDFFLTRNHHGAGFWDKEDMYVENEAGILTQISQKCGSVDVIHIRGPKSKFTFI